MVIIVLMVISLDLLIPTVNVVAEDCYGYSGLGDFRIWRWYQVLVINEDGTAKVWLRIDFQILKKEMNNYVGVYLGKIPAKKDQIICHPNNGTETSYIKFNVTEDNVRQNYSQISLLLKPETSLFYEDFSVCIEYNVSKDSILFKKSPKYSAVEKWELSYDIRMLKKLFQKNPYVEENLTAPFIQIFIVLPKTTSVLHIDENFSFYPKYAYNNLDIFRELSYWGWNGKEIPNNYQIPFEIPKMTNVVLSYIEPYTPGHVSIEYSTENRDFAKFTYKAMKAGLESKNIAIISVAIAIISLVIAIISVAIAMYASRDSKNYQHKTTNATIEEKIAMMYAYNGEVKDWIKRVGKGEIDLNYNLERINRDLSVPLDLISSYLNNKRGLNISKKESKIYETRIQQLEKLINLTNEFLNKFSEDLKEKYKEPIKKIENTLAYLKELLSKYSSKLNDD